MKKPTSKMTEARKHRRALLSAKRKKAFKKQKSLWDRGIGIYDKQ